MVKSIKPARLRDRMMDHGTNTSGARFVVVGASHEAALREAWQQRRFPRFEFINFWTLHFGGKRLDEAFAEVRAAGDVLSLIAVAFGSNAHNRACLIASPEPFGTANAAGHPVPDAMAGLRFIPRDLFRAHLKAESALMLGLIGAVHKAFPNQRIVHLCSPPPVLTMPEGPDLQTQLPEQRDFTEMLHHNPPPAALRIEAFRLQTEVFQEEAARRGVPFLCPPPAALTAEGFLQPGYVAEGDPSHANAAYGALVLDQILAHQRERA